MYTYSFAQWLLFFYIYCFLGWCFESSYVSLKQRHAVNRGFLHGPMLPIYGSGAIIVLFAALPFKDSPISVYFMGMIAATLLEYVVGDAMERIFRVRYWDYSYQRFNLNGHICLSSSIAWGFFSILMVYKLHKPFEAMVLSLPLFYCEAISFFITLIAGADFMASLKTALDIRDVIIQAERMREELEHMRRRIEIIDTFARADAENFIHKVEHGMEERFGRVEAELNRIREEIIEGRKKHSEEQLKELIEFRERLNRIRERRKDFYSKDKFRMLHGNPSARYMKLPDFLEELREEMRKAKEEK